MGIDTYITDPRDHRNAHIVTVNDGDIIDCCDKNAVVVATYPLRRFENSALYFSNPTFGINMNIQAGVFGGTPEPVYDEDTEWATSIIVGGGWVFNSGAVGAISPHSGTVMIDATTTSNNDTMQLAKGSNLDLTNYTTITGWIAISAWTTTGTKAANLIGWDTGAGAQVGTTVNIGDYVNTGITTTWQKFTIPLEDMSLTAQTIDAFRITTVDIGVGSPPDYFLDEIDVQEKGGTSDISSATFSIEPDLGTWLHVLSFTFVFADDSYSTILADSTMPGIPYNSFFGVAELSNGIVYQRIVSDEIESQNSFRKFSDIFAIPDTRLTAYGGTNPAGGSWLSGISYVAEPLVLKPENQDRLQWIISDDLSGLDVFTISAACKLEKRE
jgi:hypothetical protein